MNNLKKKIGIIFIIVTIICIACVIGLYILNKNDNEVTETAGDAEIVEYSLEELKDPIKFFSVQKCIQDNVDENFAARKMNILEGDRIFSYLVSGTTENNTDIYLIVRVDIENMTFLIEELDNNYNNINEINLETNIKEIDNDGKNAFEYITMSDKDICRFYFEQFSKLELENPEEAYKLLDEEYKNERFPTFEEYQEYVKEYRNVIENAILAKYSVNYYDEYTEYVLVDTYNNSYTLKGKSVMDYTIKLDNYTIKVDNYKEEYDRLSDEDKVQSNVYIFLQMINTKDYKHAYELLDNTFKNNNFDTLEKFKEYIQNNFFNYNLNSSDITIQEEGGYYIYKTTIMSDSSRAAETKKLNVIMKLQEGTDFVMSFNLK